MKKTSGFTLLEVLIYTGILAVIGTLFGGILLNTAQFQTKQTASSEVNQQLNFALQQIQRLVRDSSVIDINAGSATTTLKLRMKDPVKDPTTIYIANNTIAIQEGSASPLPITSSSVTADKLEFVKTSSYPGHDSVSVDMTLSYNTQNTQQSYSNSLNSAIARVSAATFDADIVPGTDNTYSVGLSSTRWKDLFLSDNLTVGNALTLGNLSSDPSGANGMIYYNTSTNKFMGYKNGSWQELGNAYWTLSGSALANSNTGSIGSWNTNANALPVTIYAQESATANGYVYVIGGVQNNFYRTTVYYAKMNSDGSTGTWSTTTSIPATKAAGASVVANGYIYVIGGFDGLNQTGSVYYAKLNADGTIGSWASTNSFPNGAERLDAVTANGYVYVIGGYNSGYTQGVFYTKLNSDGTLGPWTIASQALPAARGAAAAVVANSYVYVMGGNSGSRQATVYYAKLNSDGSVGSWSITQSLPLALDSASSVTANGYIYIYGGNAGSDQTAVYYTKINSDATIGSWSTNANSLPGARSGSSVFSNGYLYEIGGSNTNTVYYASATRVQIAGDLDLLGTASTSLSGASNQGTNGGSLYAGNIYSNGTLEVSGDARVSGNLAVTGFVTGTNVGVPAGTVIAYAGSTAPTGWLEANGTAVSRTTYPGLYAAIGTNFGNGDGATTFNVPDLRGQFIRGWDHGAGNDPDASSRTASNPGGNTGDNVGSYQQDQFKSHTHTYDQGIYPGGITAFGYSGSQGVRYGASTGATGGNETRPKNTNLMYIIKY